MINFSIIGQLKYDNAVGNVLQCDSSSVRLEFRTKIRERGQSMWELGWRFCGHCQKFYKVIGRKCKICGEWLRWKPRGRALQEYNKRNGIYDKAYSMTDDQPLLQNI